MEPMRPFRTIEDQEEFTRDLDALLERWYPRFVESPNLTDAVLDGLNPSDPMLLDGWIVSAAWVNSEGWLLPFCLKRDRQGLFYTRGMAEELADWAGGLMEPN